MVGTQHVDEVVNSQLRDKFAEKMASLSKGEMKTFEEMFFFACPKFMSPIPPDYDSLPENCNKVRHPHTPTHAHTHTYSAPRSTSVKYSRLK